MTFTVDGREVTAPQNMMLADAALEYGDVEIPVFCYEKKLGPPIGACRMCLVEIEGIPKLQAGCSVAVKDGMVVHTNTPRVQEAQQGVLEFILINHPLDCPVCDKGGECPLQDKSFGWGGGISRFVDPKRHFEKPLALSPLIAIDRERCILCYRCVRFSQEVSEDYQLILQERGAGTYVATFDGHPYVAPFSGNIIELCPVGALTSRPYRFRARPWDIEQSGSVCTLCPAQCNVSFTVRDERVLRVLQRDHEGVDDGWLCDKGRFAYQAIHVDERITQPLLRDGGELRPVPWELALETAATTLAKAGARTGALAGGETTNEEGWLLQQLMRGALGSADLDSRAGGALPLELHRALGAPALQASVADLEFADAVLVLDTEPVDDAPILDLRIRKGVRQRGVQLHVATSRPSSLDERAAGSVRFAPGAGEATARRARRRAQRCGRPRRPRRERRRRRRRRPRAGRRAEGRGRGRRDPLGRASHPRARRRRRRPRAAQRRLAPGPRGPRRRGPDRDSRRHERPRAARGGRPAERGTRPLCSRTRQAATHRRSPPPWPPATSRRSTCCTPTRSATSPAAMPGAKRSSGRRPSSRTRASSPRASASTRPSSSPPSPTRRRRAPSCTPTVACSACGARSAARAARAASGRSSPSSRSGSAATSARAPRRW